VCSRCRRDHYLSRRGGGRARPAATLQGSGEGAGAHSASQASAAAASTATGAAGSRGVELWAVGLRALGKEETRSANTRCT
jgi:hypothetical protein